MTRRLPAHRTGDDDLDALLVELLDTAGATRDRDLIFEILASAVRLVDDAPDRLDLKITNAALKEMREAFLMFSPYRDVSKVTIFGSARTRPEDPLYAQTSQLAAALADRGWMVVTGAGPGIMAAGMEGAGRENAIGVLIRLPFEGGANEVIAGDDKLIEMKYFFTRKLMLIKESGAFVALPGGFGTLDETFELLTLVQTGKAVPVPIVLLDTPGGTYWHGFEHFLREEVAANGMISPADEALYRITDDVDLAVAEIEGFYRNYHSLRYVGDRLVIRLHAEPTRAELDDLSAEFADILQSGRIERTKPFPPEVSGRDHLDLPRVVLRFDNHGFARLRSLIDDLNRLDSAPATPSKPPTVAEQEAVEENLDEEEAVS
ncbi:MAG TPA: TIGR00730 family Rossman fold protein [Acidimicrobiales bacterium]|nr:TIGR00730 family Rossman fold protein [Acidimicrobiales bacterium]